MSTYDIKCENCEAVTATASFLEPFAVDDPHLRQGLCPACTLIKFPPLAPSPPEQE